MSSQLTNIPPFKAELQTNKLLLVENISFQQRRNMETHTHAHIYTNTLPFFLVLSQGPISGPRLSAQACVWGPIGSPQGCMRPQGSRRIITLFISLSLSHLCIHTSTICSQPVLLSLFCFLFFFPLLLRPPEQQNKGQP